MPNQHNHLDAGLVARLRAQSRKGLRKVRELAARIEGLVPLLIGAIIVLLLVSFNHQQFHSGPFLAMLACIALLVLIGKASKDRPDH